MTAACSSPIVTDTSLHLPGMYVFEGSDCIQGCATAVGNAPALCNLSLDVSPPPIRDRPAEYLGLILLNEVNSLAHKHRL